MGSSQDIFILPDRDLMLPDKPTGMAKVKCEICGEEVLSCDSRQHSAQHNEY